jgi:hypothetical protein
MNATLFAPAVIGFSFLSAGCLSIFLPLSRQERDQVRLFEERKETSKIDGGCGVDDPTMRASARTSVMTYAQQYPAARAGSQREMVLEVFQRALDGDYRALAMIFSDYDTYGSSDSEAWCKVPWEVLRALGDERFSKFVESQPDAVRAAAFRWLVGLFGGTEAELKALYPKTAKLHSDPRFAP